MCLILSVGKCSLNVTESTGQKVLTWTTTETLDWACNPPLLVVFWTLTKSHAKSHVKDGPLRRKDVAILDGVLGPTSLDQTLASLGCAALIHGGMAAAVSAFGRWTAMIGNVHR